MARYVFYLSLAALTNCASAATQSDVVNQEALRPSAQCSTLIEKVRMVLARKPSFHAKIMINGEPLDQTKVMRQMIYLAGQDLLRLKFKEMATAAELAKQVKEGADPEDYVVTEIEIDARVKAVAKNSGGLEALKAALRKSGYSFERFRRTYAAELLFGKVFIPMDPEDWPDVTVRAFEGQPAPWPRIPKRRGNRELTRSERIMRAWLLKCLRKNATIEYAVDGLAPEYCMRVDGRAWKTRDALRALGSSGGEAWRELAVCSVIIDSLVEKELRRHNAWLDDATIKKDFEKYRTPFDRTPFTVKVLATTFKGYPSFDSYRSRWRLLHCYERLIAADIKHKNLSAHIERAGFVLGDGKVQLRLLRVPFENGKRLAGIKAAHARALEIARRLRASELKIDAVSKLYPTIKLEVFDAPLSFKELRPKLHESEFYDIFLPTSAAKAIFNEAKKNEVYGPVMGRKEFFIAELTGRKGVGAAAVALVNKDMRRVTIQDYITTRFVAWARQLGTSAIVK